MFQPAFFKLFRNINFVVSTAAIGILIILSYCNAYILYSPLWTLSITGFLYLLLVFSAVTTEKYKDLLYTLDLNIKNMEDVNRELRTFRHDLFNHLQVVSALIQQKKYDIAKDYLMSLGRLEKFSFSSKIDNIAFNSLIQAKKDIAEKSGVSFLTDISAYIEGLQGISCYDLARVIGNIIDNAIYEESLSQNDCRQVKLNVFETRENYIFSIYNRNSYISRHLMPKIFNAGFTTKKDAGQGLGLYSVKKIISQCRGNIKIISKKGKGTEFIVSIPKSKMNMVLDA